MDKDRRTFLKIIVFGFGTIMIGKVLGPLFSKILDDPMTKIDSLSKINSLSPLGTKTFKVVENDKILSILDNSGEEIFQIDKEG